MRISANSTERVYKRSHSVAFKWYRLSVHSGEAADDSRIGSIYNVYSIYFIYKKTWHDFCSLWLPSLKRKGGGTKDPFFFNWMYTTFTQLLKNYQLGLLTSQYSPDITLKYGIHLRRESTCISNISHISEIYLGKMTQTFWKATDTTLLCFRAAQKNTHKVSTVPPSLAKIKQWRHFKYLNDKQTGLAPLLCNRVRVLGVFPVHTASYHQTGLNRCP